MVTASAQIPLPTPKTEIYKANDFAGLHTEVGRRVTVEGTVVAAGESKTGTVYYLNFSRERNKTVALVFFAKKMTEPDLKQKLNNYVGKTVRARGAVAEYRGSVEIQMSSLEDLQVVP
jgi:DNA/RNA endonuclease YhcR with UshA esterase domain